MADKDNRRNDVPGRRPDAAKKQGSGAHSPMRHVTAKVSASDSGYDYAQELRGRTAEDMAGKKSSAKVETGGGKWEASSEDSHTSDRVTADEVSDRGNKHAVDSGRAKTYHTINGEDGSHFRAVKGDTSEEQYLDAKATDMQGRSLTLGDGIKTSPLEMGTIGNGQSDKAKENRAKKAVKEASIKRDKEADRDSDSDGFLSDSIKAPRSAVAKRVGQNAGKLSDLLGDQSGAPEGEDVGASVMRQSENMVKGQISAVAGGIAASRSAKAYAKDSIMADMSKAVVRDSDGKTDAVRSAEARDEKTQVRSATVREEKTETRSAIAKEKTDFRDRKGIRVTEDGEGSALRRGLNAAESASGGKFVTGSKNSYGSVTKDVRNNLYIIDTYFAKKGTDLSKMTDRQIENFMRKGKLPQKDGQLLSLTEADKALLEERGKLTKRKKALKAAGTWHDEKYSVGFLDSAIKGTDAGDEIVEAKENAKQAVSTAKGISRGAKAVASAGNRAFRGAVTAAEGGMLAGSAAAHATALAGGPGEADPKLIKKWRADEKAKFKARNAKIKAEAGRVRKKPGTEAARGMKAAYDKTIGKTAFGKRIAGSRAADSVKRGQKWFMGKRNALAKKERDREAAKLAKKAAGKGSIFTVFGRAVSYAKAGIAIGMAAVIAGSTVIIILTAGISSVMPMGADKANFEAGELTMWETSKESMNLELQGIVNECTDFVSSNYAAFRKRRRGKALPSGYTVNFIFNGFEFSGPKNNVTERDQGDAGTSDTGSGYHGGDGQLQEENASTTVATTGSSDSIQEEANMGDPDYMAKYQSREGRTLTRSAGRRVNQYGVEETYYNMDMANCEFTLDRHVRGLNGLSENAHQFVRSDGVKMYGDENGTAYVMVAADLSIYPKGTIVRTSLGPGIVCDAGSGVVGQHFDIAVNEQWHSQVGGTNSGTVDTWGSDLNTGAVFANGSVACAPNYLRGILAMATAVTGNEDNEANRKFYSDYCVHLIRNSWNYTKYVAATNWKKHQESESIDSNEDDMDKAWDDSYADDVITYGGMAFDISVVDKEYNDKGHQISTTYALTCYFLDCGLWGDDVPPKMIGKKDYSDDGGTAGTAGGTPGMESTAAGKFDTETYQFETTDELGDEIKNDVADNAFIHKLSAGGTSEYDPDVTEGQPGYEYWDGWEDKGFLSNDEVIYESGSNPSSVEGTYDLSDDDYSDMGISLGGIYNISNFTEDGGVGGQAADPLPEDEIQQILSNAQEELGDDRALEERMRTVEGALRLVGKATYDFGAMHGSYHGVSKGSGSLDGFGTTSDCSGYVSYVLWQGGAKASDGVNSCATFVNKGKAVDPSELKPGDIIVKNNGRTASGGWDSHVVMYVGRTPLGNFTVAECTTRNGKSGPQLNGYDSWANFQNKRGTGYSHTRSLF